MSALETIAESKLLNILASLGLILLTIGIWSGESGLFWKILCVPPTLFQIGETRKLYKR